MKPFVAVALGLTCLLAAGCGSGGPGVDWSAAPATGAKVRVVYAHRTLRCISCLLIEKLARETVQEDFADRLADGSLQWQTVDFWQDREFANRYGVDTATVVVITYANGRQSSFQRLDQLWGLKLDGDKFRAVLREAVSKALQDARDPQAGRDHGIRAIPTHLFFDAAGRELYRHEGFPAKEAILAKWRELGVAVR